MSKPNYELNELINATPEHFDLTDRNQQQRLLELADALLSFEHLTNEELRHASVEGQAPLEFRLAVMLVESRRAMLLIDRPVSVGVVFAMWGEHNRLLPCSADNPNGEDSLRVKIEQLQWVTKDTQVDWHLYAVDDGCPHNSAEIASEVLHNCAEDVKECVTVLKLESALPAEHGPLRNLPSANESRKGGAIVYGCQQALELGVEAVIYTDADNSVHLGQIGLLLQHYVDDAQHCVLGNRKDPKSILVKQEARWGVGIKSLRHMQRMIGVEIFSQGIKDTQAAFKLYSRSALEHILMAPTVYDFSFDTDWIFAVMAQEYPIKTVPFAFIDSAAESASITQGPMTTWFVLLEGLVKSAQAREIPYNREMAEVFLSQIQSHEDLELIIDVLPPQLISVKETQLGDPKVMSPQAMKQWIMSAKAMSTQIASLE